jgi:hypothetical protein
MPRSRTLTPLKTLWAGNQGKALALPEALRRLYGRFRLPQAGSLPYIFSNFVTTLDGVDVNAMREHSRHLD